MIFDQFVCYKCSNSINVPVQHVKQISKFKLDHFFDLANNQLQDDELIPGKKKAKEILHLDFILNTSFFKEKDYEDFNYDEEDDDSNVTQESRVRYSLLSVYASDLRPVKKASTVTSKILLDI